MVERDVDRPRARVDDPAHRLLVERPFEEHGARGADQPLERPPEVVRKKMRSADEP